MEVKVLQATDVTGGTFSLALAGMIATAVLLLLGTGWVSRRWKLPVGLAATFAVVAAAFYFEAREVWTMTGQMPVIYRYVAWMVTVPIQVAILYFFIGTMSAPPVGLFWRLLAVSAVMVLARYMGEVDFLNATLAFLIALALWLYILGEVFFGRLSEINSQHSSEAVQRGFFWLRLIVSVGWAVYPLCYFIARFAGGVGEGPLSIVYNLADIVNEMLFGLIVLTVAMRESSSAR
jgi:bacteriorhodopsin